MEKQERKIYIYLDDGVSRSSFLSLLHGIRALSHLPFTVRSIDAKALLTTDWEQQTALLVFPGGRDVPYHQKLQGEANRRIRNFVEKGGKYLGICAGAYYASSFIEFEKGGELEVEAERELKFFPGKAVGSLFGLNEFCYKSERGTRAVLLDWEEEVFSVYYKGGCSFEGNYPNVSILARYANIPAAPPAIIHCSFGSGEAILSGVHPEYRAHTLNPDDPYLKEHIPALSSSEEQRARLFNHLLGLILI